MLRADPSAVRYVLASVGVPLPLEMYNGHSTYTLAPKIWKLWSYLCRNYVDRVCSDGAAKPRDESYESAPQDTERWSTDVKPPEKMVRHVIFHSFFYYLFLICSH